MTIASRWLVAFVALVIAAGGGAMGILFGRRRQLTYTPPDRALEAAYIDAHDVQAVDDLEEEATVHGEEIALLRDIEDADERRAQIAGRANRW